jgi:hypothetical protein
MGLTIPLVASRMSSPSSRRTVHLIDARLPTRPLVKADLYRDYPVAELETIETHWAKARDEAATAALVQGLTPLEHVHWDWRNKAESVEAGRHMLLGVECDGAVQGLMAVLRLPRRARLGTGQVVYVDFVEAAPWNLRGSAAQPRFLGVGTVLIAEAVRLSLDMGLGGQVGLHSLPQAEEFYATRCKMTQVGVDPAYFDLTYFEHTRQQAADWLAHIGEVP